MRKTRPTSGLGIKAVCSMSLTRPASFLSKPQPVSLLVLSKEVGNQATKHSAQGSYACKESYRPLFLGTSSILSHASGPRSVDVVNSIVI